MVEEQSKTLIVYNCFEILVFATWLEAAKLEAQRLHALCDLIQDCSALQMSTWNLCGSACHGRTHKGLLPYPIYWLPQAYSFPITAEYLMKVMKHVRYSMP